MANAKTKKTKTPAAKTKKAPAAKTKKAPAAKDKKSKAPTAKKAAPTKKAVTTKSTSDKKSTPAAKKPAAKKAPVAAKAAPAKKAASSKATPPKKSTPSKKSPPAAKKAPAKKSPAKKAPAKKAPTNKAQAKTTPAKKAAKPVTGKRGLKGQAAPVVGSARVGKVDSAANLSTDAVLAEEERDMPLDAMLTQIEVSQNMDKYFILQVICEPPNSTSKKAKTGKGKKPAASTTEQFYFFTRWGRTGTTGSCKLEGPFDDLDSAVGPFEAKFKEKTGNDWNVNDHEDRYVANAAGKYTCLRPNATQVMPQTWQYWVDDKVDGKDDGWYDYDDTAAAIVEQLYTEFQTNPTLHQRVVASGAFMYHVDLSAMTQTNVTHPGRKMRHIRRNPGGSLPNTPPGTSTAKVAKGKGKASTAPAAPAATPAPSASSAEVDSACPKAGDKGVSVCAGHDVKLNQTNISANNNKFYILQVERGGVEERVAAVVLGPAAIMMCHDTTRKEWFVWCRWGRVGETGATSELGPFSEEDAASTAFAKKFRDKTGNKWQDAQKGDFTAVAGKYELIETDNSDTTEAAALVASGGGSGPSGPPAKILPSKLDAPTKELVELIFSEDMFKSAMATMNVDVKKMPLGQLSAAQVQRGYAVLEELEDALKSSGRARANTLETLSARFYQVIPHAFGRNRPPVIDNASMLQDKVEMLNVLQDISEAQSMLSSTDSKKGKGKGKKAEAAPPAVPHPTDVNYGLLNANLELVSTQSPEYQIIKQYMENTKPGYGDMQLYDVWAVDRQGEAQRFTAHNNIANRKLLWHGTNVAVVAAIVKSGLRIMPHSGGRVGKGIYLASENAKSRQYVWPAYKAKNGVHNVGIMFLCEAALGKEASITMDDFRLTAPPKGYDSIVARGTREPDPSKDVTLTIDGKSVTVPQGKPRDMPQFKGSNFANSEYLLYQESQQRIRYLLTVKC